MNALFVWGPRDKIILPLIAAGLMLVEYVFHKVDDLYHEDARVLIVFDRLGGTFAAPPRPAPLRHGLAGAAPGTNPTRVRYGFEPTCWDGPGASGGRRPRLSRPARRGGLRRRVSVCHQVIEFIGKVAPEAGIEPATIRLTVECSTAELLGNRAFPPHRVGL